MEVYMADDTWGLFDEELENEYSKEEIEMRYITARLDFLRADDPTSKFFFSTDVLYFGRIGKFSPKELGALRAKTYELLRSGAN
jgi:hypothetical protein